MKMLLHQCTICKRHSGKPYATPDPPPLLKTRTLDIPPFTGSLYVRQNSEEMKVYLCLFMCTTSRAIHLEVVNGLSTETFMPAFRRFAGRKSLSQIIMLDNAFKYQSAATELHHLFTSKILATSLERQGVEWKFILKKAPWFGCYWQ